MIQPGFQDGRRAAVILCGTQNNNHIGSMGIVTSSKITDFAVEVDEVHRQAEKANESYDGSPLEDPADHATRLLILPSKNSARVSNGTGPSRRRTGGSTDKS